MRDASPSHLYHRTPRRFATCGSFPLVATTKPCRRFPSLMRAASAYRARHLFRHSGDFASCASFSHKGATGGAASWVAESVRRLRLAAGGVGGVFQSLPLRRGKPRHGGEPSRDARQSGGGHASPLTPNESGVSPPKAVECYSLLSLSPASLLALSKTDARHYSTPNARSCESRHASERRKTYRQQAGWEERQQAAAVHRLRRW